MHLVEYASVIYLCIWQILNSDQGEDPESHAAKLLEVILLQYKGQVDQVCL